MFYIIFIISFLFSDELLKGYVFDSFDNPIKNVNVEIVNENIGTATDKLGYFIINIDNGKVLKLTHIAFDYKEIDLETIGSNTITVFLEEKDINFERVVVTGTKSDRYIKDTPMLTHVIANTEIDNSSYVDVKNMLEIAMPNVQMVASNHGENRVKIQGLDNKYLTFLLDGDRVSGEFAGNLDFSMLGLSNVEKIEVIEGALSTLYGSGAVGGVVNIISKINKNPYWFNTSTQYDDYLGITPSINTGFNKGILYYNLNIQYSESNGYDLTPDDPGEYDMTLDENNSKILNHNIAISPSDKHHFQFVFKDYFSRIIKRKYVGQSLFLGRLNRYQDEYNKMKYHYKISENKSFKVSYIEEEYLKHYFYPYYYSSGEYIYNPEEFLNGALNRKELNIQYNNSSPLYKRLIGLEAFNEDYSSYNIDLLNGEVQESIFNGEDQTINDSDISLYYYEERNLIENKVLAIGIRVQSLNDANRLLPSISYLIKGKNNYNYRISYSSGYRKPSIKERYYQWADHEGGPELLGNPNLKPTKNDYFSISLDKRTYLNDFSVDIYSNNIKNMISTEYDSNGDYLMYRNYNKVIINGLNVHYFRKISNDLRLKFVYNLTDATSKSDEILEGISKHAFRININHKILESLEVVTNIKYVGNKFIFDQEQDFVGNESIKKLSSYFLTDMYLISNHSNIIFKVGLKNLFNYKDSNRFSTDILNTYDPGRRLFCEIGFKFPGDINNAK